MKVCAFCGNPGGNLEHIIARCLIKRMQVHDFPVQYKHFKYGTGIVSERPSHSLNTYATKSVCRGCNNGWMSQLDELLEHRFGQLIEPTLPPLSAQILKKALRDPEVLAKWALKTAITASLNSTLESVIDEQTATDLCNDRIPKSVHVDLGVLRDPTVGVMMFKGFWWLEGMRRSTWVTHKDNLAFHVVFQLNHLAIRVFRAPEARPVRISTNGMQSLRCFPKPQDPELNDFVFRDLQGFAHSLQVRFEDSPSA